MRLKEAAELLVIVDDVLDAAESYKRIVQKPKTPFVKLVGGGTEDLDMQRAKKRLFEALDNLENLG